MLNLGAALLEVRTFEKAIAASTPAADILRETGDQHGEGQALNDLGLALREAGRLEEAIDAHAQAADIMRPVTGADRPRQRPDEGAEVDDSRRLLWPGHRLLPRDRRKPR
ncbi:tetratricopeptide repeat protein [Streptomyces sp. NPDC050392]|uniref:tetratricopeptide repeat protein n=1 Tax=Streptomyces sp. NPDC050392 TaxID=3155782 RepID=UPI003437D617